jgi:hypothetical protein
LYSRIDHQHGGCSWGLYMHQLCCGEVCHSLECISVHRLCGWALC